MFRYSFKITKQSEAKSVHNRITSSIYCLSNTTPACVIHVHSAIFSAVPVSFITWGDADIIEHIALCIFYS